MPAGRVAVDAAPLQTSWPETVRMTPRARSSRASLSPRSRSSATISVPSGITRLGRSPPPRTLSGANEKATTRGDGGGDCGPDGPAADDGGESVAVEGAMVCTDDARYRQSHSVPAATIRSAAAATSGKRRAPIRAARMELGGVSGHPGAALVAANPTRFRTVSTRTRWRGAAR